MGKYFEALNLTECNDALMGVIYYSIRLSWRLITGVMALYMQEYSRTNMHTHTHTHLLIQSSPLNVHM